MQASTLWRLCLVLVCAYFSSSAQSAVVSVTVPILGPSFPGSGKGLVRYNTLASSFILEDQAIVNATFDRLDASALGELVGVEISLNYSLSGNLGSGLLDAPIYPASIAGVVDVSEHVLLGFTSSLFTSPTKALGSYQLGCTAAAPSGASDPLVPDCTKNEPAVAGGTVQLSFDQSSPFLSEFLLQPGGSQTWIMSLRLDMLLSPEIIADTEYSMAMSLNQIEFAEYNIDYIISEVPIPASFWLFGSALLGLVGLHRRRKIA